MGQEDGISTEAMLRFVGLAAICVGLAWAVQVICFGDDGLGRFAWLMSAAVACGIGAGLLVTSRSVGIAEPVAG